MDQSVEQKLQQSSAIALMDLQGSVSSITFYNPENHFAVIKLLLESGNTITAVGVMPYIQLGETVSCSGQWQTHPEHGKQFQISSFRFELPTNEEAICKFLSSGFAPGIGPIFAQKIVSLFGADIFNVLENEPERLEAEVEGLGKLRAESLVDAWRRHTTFQEIQLTLLQWGVSKTALFRILKRWGAESLRKIQEDPYQLAKEIDGIGFTLADGIAKRLGFLPHSKQRLRAGVDYLLWELVQEGHTCYPLQEFVQHAASLLAVETSLIEDAIADEVEDKNFILIAQPSAQSQHASSQCQLKEILFVAPKGMFACEETICMHIERLKSATENLRTIDLDKAVLWVETTLHLKLAPEQREAVFTSLKEPFSIITGGPGTGKSTITKALIAILAHLSPGISLAAPTGRAAKRLSEITKRHASTIHRLLKFDHKIKGFQHNAQNPLTCSVLIIDEASMLDAMLTAHLFRAIPSGCKVIIIGDVDQLPSVGSGNVLRDMIRSNKVPVVRLKTIFRQAAHSAIIRAAHRINQGELPPFKNYPGSEYLFIEREEPEEIICVVKELLTKTLPERFGYDPRFDIQLLAPMRKGRLGLDAFNKELQRLYASLNSNLGPNQQPSQPTGFPFCIGDKVLQLRNNYDREVFNGDVGIVDSIDTESGRVRVDMDGTFIEYDKTDLDELSLAWAVSVHKYQGSEIPCVVVICHTQHFKLLNKNLLYTAVTRGKKHVIVIGTKRAVAIAVKQGEVDTRFSTLGTLLILAK